MILDTSAVVAIAMKEPGYEELLQRMASSDPAIGTATLAETAIVLSTRLQRDTRSLLARFLSEASIAIVPFGESHYGAAVDAWLRYGKGRHPAALNFGDCLSYAVARLANEPLLFVGDDFAQTDIART
ncbi:MAG: type II toxin-antitoxin system VapC family toxin [Spirochaetes bacterium]|nr:type II toxin-antitoxin system VapC family toxin [Spirochaetota bacterium]